MHGADMTEQIPDGWQAREYHKLALGGVLFELALRAGDANALEALLRMPVSEFRNLRQAKVKDPDACLADVLRTLIDENEPMLDSMGRSHVIARRRKKYSDDCENWTRAGADGPEATWRGKYMTKAQRYLIHQLCLAKGIEPPVGLDRGGAADWLDANGAHHIYSEE